MMAGEGGIVSGFHNKMQVAGSRIVPDERLAKQHAKMAAPGTAEK